jgi:uncharacterized membrane protein YbhN (UPF0104 family)
LTARVDLTRTGEILGRVSLPELAAALIALAAATALVALRWHFILAAGGDSPGPGVLLKIVFVGMFFNQVLPTGVGGDVVRAWRCVSLGIGPGPAIRSVLLDRASGYFVFVVLYAATLPTLLHALLDARQGAGAVILLALAGSGIVALLLLDKLPQRLMRLSMLAPLAALSRQSRRLCVQPRTIVPVLGISMVVAMLNILTFKLLGGSVAIGLAFATWVAVVPPITLIQLLPVSLAGWGIREVGLVVALAAFGVPAEPALAVSLLFGLVQIVIGLPGGVIWLFGWDVAAARERAPLETANGAVAQLVPDER